MDGGYNYALSILKSNDGESVGLQPLYLCIQKPVAGEGHFIHTYMCDGNPLPSFEGEPKSKIRTTMSLQRHSEKPECGQ